MHQARDIFEFHCAYATEEKKREALDRFFTLLRVAAKNFHVPTLFSTRPPWDNNTRIAHWCIGGDVLLPKGETVQCACLYNQGQIFSTRYNITYRTVGQFLSHTHQLVGAITRRYAFAHYMLGLRRDASFAFHPDLCEFDVEILARETSSSPDEKIAALRKRFQTSGTRVRLQHCRSSREVSQARKAAADSGNPLILMILAPRKAGDPYKTVWHRRDIRSEYVTYDHRLDEHVQTTENALEDIGHHWDHRMGEFMYARVRDSSLEEAHKITRNGRIAVCAMEPTPSATQRAADTGAGEVLGFVRRSSDEILGIVARRM